MVIHIVARTNTQTTGSRTFFDMPHFQKHHVSGKLSHPKNSGDTRTTSRHCGKEHVCGTIFISHGFLTTMKNRNIPELAPVPKEVLDGAKVVPSVPLTLLDMYA